MIGGDLFVAATISTKRFAKRQMNVQANAFAAVVQGKLLLQLLCPLANNNCLLPYRNGGVAGVSGYRQVVFFNQRFFDLGLHEAKFPVQPEKRTDQKCMTI